jgi:fatty-acyl-CoA synthase/long-chain acyl-CoA synthetase
VATAPPELVRRKPDTVGAPLDGIELRLRESGEICIRGATVAPTVVDDGGWFATGDLAEFDDDGHLRLTGRLGDRIISGGVNVDPLSVETVMGELSGVAAVAVVGVPDDQWGEVVAALVVPGPDARPDPAALISAARARLAGAEIPRWIEIADALPLNTNGKVDRGQIRERLTRGYLPAAPQPWGETDSVQEEREVGEE